MSRLRRAIVRLPARTFAAGLTSADLGAPDLALALEQHEHYCAALMTCGLELTVLEPDPHFPDSTFVEDTAVLTPELAVILRPGAPSRAGETAAIREALLPLYRRIESLSPPGTVDGGDVCAAGTHVFIGLSQRTNEPGARQLARLLTSAGCTSSLIDIRCVPGILHLKSGLAYLGGEDLVAIDALADHPALERYRRLRLQRDEEYAANCVCVNERVLVAAGFPRLAETLERAGYSPLALEMSEFHKQDGGLSCLSLRF